MIYVCELQDKNLFVFNCVFDLGDSNATNSYCGSFLDENFDNHMKNVWGVEKFDIIIGNPPYQTQKEGNTKTHPLWHLFVEKSISILIDGGYLNMVHPSGWRNVDGMFKNTQKLMLSKQFLYLEIHSQEDGVKTFGAETRYDFYCLSNKKVLGYKTKIKCQDGTFEFIDISNFNFIPNGMFNEISKLLSNGNDNIETINNSSYHHQRNHVNDILINDFIYPCVYSVMKEETKFKYSNTNSKGHFNIPKLIWGSGRIKSVGSLLDLNGEYGLTEFASAIVDTKENLIKIKEVFDSKKFRTIMEQCSVSSMSINHKVIGTFRKDFYKQFLND
jgi:hypothetical protein